MIPRTFPMYVREVESLLITARGIRPQVARAVCRDMDEAIESAWRRRQPPCLVAEHLARSAKRAYGRDAENPKAGEVYETKRGDRWKVEDVSERSVRVRRAGRREGPDSFAWGRGNLKRLRQVGDAPSEPKPRRKKAEPAVATDRDKSRRRSRRRWRTRR